MQTTSILTCVLLLSLWTAAWLNWCFNGEIRNWIVALFPESWRGGTPRREILDMAPEDLLLYLCATSTAPRFFSSVLTCPRCLSAHVAGVGAIIITSAGVLDPWLIPLVWAAGAWVGLQLFSRS